MNTPSLNFDQIAERYDETRGGERRGRQFAADLAPLLDRERLAVEIGIGTGVIALALNDLGFNVKGLDISELMLARAKARVGPSLVQADAQHLPLATDALDQAFSVWVLHAVGDVPAALREVGRVLRPGGRYLVMDGRFFQNDDDSDAHATAWRDITSGLRLEPRRNRADEWGRLAPSCGLRVADMVTSGPHEFEDCPAALADRIETRVHSPLWNVTDADWERVVVPVIARLRALPNADRPVVQKEYQDILILERAAA